MKTSYIELAGKKHPLRLSLGAAEKLSEEFGSLDAMEGALLGKDIPQAESIRIIDRVLTILMEAGRIYASASGEELPPKLTCRPVDLIDAGDPAALQSILAAMTNDTDRTVETVAKNAEATQTP